MKKFLGLRGQALNLAVGTIAGCDFLLFGYGEQKPRPWRMGGLRQGADLETPDQGVMGGILTLSVRPTLPIASSQRPVV